MLLHILSKTKQNILSNIINEGSRFSTSDLRKFVSGRDYTENHISRLQFLSFNLKSFIKHSNILLVFKCVFISVTTPENYEEIISEILKDPPHRFC